LKSGLADSQKFTHEVDSVEVPTTHKQLACKIRDIDAHRLNLGRGTAIRNRFF
jgi:hypothetical protein